MKIKRFFFLNLATLCTIIIVLTISYVFSFGFFKEKQIALLVGAQEENKDVSPPKLSEIKILDVTGSSSVISWTTDEKADSIINYSLDKNYGIARDPLFTHTSHKIIVSELKPDTTYYFRVISSDALGNQAISGDYSFTTTDAGEQSENASTEPIASSSAANNGKGPEPETGKGKGTETTPGEAGSAKITQEIMDLLEKITNPEDLVKLSETIDSIAGGELAPPSVLGSSPQVEVGSDYAIVKWVTDKKSNSIVAFASEKAFSPSSDNPYEMKVGEPSEMVLEHEVRIGNLSPATVYHYQVLSKPEVGPEGKSKDFTFKTKSILPEIYNIKASKIEEDAATITWTTNVPTKAIVEYTNLKKKETKLAGSSNPVTIHSLRISDLIIDTTYSAIIHAENENGEKADSPTFTFTTVKDVVPPVISKINTESTLYPGADNKVQTIISWETDELSVCQFSYQEGILASKKGESKLPIEADYVSKHIQVITAFSQATVYKYWIICQDRSKNEVRSDSFTILTPAQEQSIIDMIIGNFESTFGWLKKK